MSHRIHFPLFFLALFVAVALKVTIAETERLSEKTIDVKVTYRRPDGVMILDPIKEVEVLLRGRQSEIAQLNPIFVDVVAIIAEDQVGKLEIPLDRNNVRTPGDLQVVSITPNRLSLDVEPVETAIRPIRVAITGEPAAGALVGELLIQPGTAEIRGPSSRIAEITVLNAGPISVDRRAITFTDNLPVLAGDPLVEVLRPSTVSVTVPMEEPELSSPLIEEESPS